MNNTLPVANIIKSLYGFDLVGGLNELCKYGKPRLSYMGNGKWYCVVDMYVQGKGVQFEVKSTFEETSALQAVIVTFERLQKALKDLGL